MTNTFFWFALSREIFLMYHVVLIRKSIDTSIVQTKMCNGVRRKYVLLPFRRQEPTKPDGELG